MNILNYIHKQLSEAKISFTLNEVENELGSSRKATLMALSRLHKKGLIVSPAEQFYLIIPYEYQRLGCLPPEQFIPHLMAFWNSSYYVGLLSAAEFHGAAHQKSPYFQVMVPKRHPDLTIGKIHVRFIQKKEIDNRLTAEMNTPKSIFKISTPALTAMDLLLYPGRSGGLNHIATVLTELAESINGEELKLLAENSDEMPWIQRLGYLLTKVGHEALTEGLYKVIENKKLPIIGLNSNTTKIGYVVDKKWRVAINMDVESDI